MRALRPLSLLRLFSDVISRAFPIVALLLIAGLTHSAYAQSENQLSVQEIQDGWELLFDGESMDRWRMYNGGGVPDTWSVQDGMMGFRPPETDGEEGDRNIITKRKYRNFHLKLEWQIEEGGNSGLFYGVLEQPEKEIYWSAPEYQIIDNSIFDDGGEAAKRMSGSLYDLIAAQPQNAKPIGEWNSAQIIVDGSRVEHWQNGVKVVETKRWNADWYNIISNSKFECHNEFGNIRQGHIGIQDHGGVIRIKNIKVKTLE